jgi:putative cell wall-binding protein
VTTERLGGADRYLTSVAVSTRTFPEGGVPVVYLASGAGFADALAAGPAAAKDGGALLLTRPDGLPPAVAAELARLAPGRVVVAGGPAALSETVVAQVRATLGPDVPIERAAGADRYGTAAALVERAFGAPERLVFLASGAGFADALAAGGVAAALGAPILLTRPDRLPPATALALRRLRPERVVIAGGPASVTPAVAAAVAALGPSVERVGGADRFATAANLAARFLPDATTVLAASGLGFADALAAIPLAGRLGGPILLTWPDSVSWPTSVPLPTRDEIRRRAPSSIIVLGGPAAVSEFVRYELVGWADGRLSVPPPTPDYPAFDARYHNPTELLNAVTVAAIWRPDLVEIFSIGTSHQGRDIWAAKVSDHVAVDEPEPEVLVDALHHAREHLTVEQALYLLDVLVGDYERDPTVRRLVDEREVFIVFALNPDGWAFDLGGSPYRGWRKNRQPNAGTSAVGTDLNRNYGYRWGCCGGSSGNPSAFNYRGPAPWSAPETRVMRDFVESRVVDGRQQIRTHVSLHTNGELILYPYGYTKVDVPADMDPVDQRTFVAMARAMARTNGYRAMQSSDLYITDGDQIDWMYARHGIFSFTFELYPTEQVSSHADHEPPDEVIVRETTRNRAALLYLIDLADCPYRAIGATDRCG